MQGHTVRQAEACRAPAPTCRFRCRRSLWMLRGLLLLCVVGVVVIVDAVVLQVERQKVAKAAAAAGYDLVSSSEPTDACAGRCRRARSL